MVILFIRNQVEITAALLKFKVTIIRFPVTILEAV